MHRSILHLGLLALLLFNATGLKAQQPSDSLPSFQAIKILPLYLLTFDAQQLRLGFETGTALASWQYDLGLILPVYQADIHDENRSQLGFALQAARRWGISETTYLSASAEYRFITYRIEDFVGRGCEDGRCDFQQLVNMRQNVHSPTTHLLFGKRYLRRTGKTFVDLEGGVGYKWAFRSMEEGEPFFMFDMVNGSSLVERKFNLRLNLNIGFML